MKTAISTACFYLKEETENALSLIAKTGAEACSVFLQTFYEYRPEFAKKYAQNLGGIEVCSVETSAHNFEHQLFSPSRRIRGDGFYWLEQVMRSSQLFGAKRYILKAPLLSSDGDFEDGLQYLNGICEFLAGYGVALCVENSPLGLLSSPSQVQKIKSACPQALFSLDLRGTEQTATDFRKYLKATAGSLAQVVVERADAELVKQLKSTGFDGEIIVKTQNFTQLPQLEELINQIKSIG